MQNLRQKTAYSGCALSLIDALSTLAVIGDMEGRTLALTMSLPCS